MWRRLFGTKFSRRRVFDMPPVRTLVIPDPVERRSPDPELAHDVTVVNVPHPPNGDDLFLGELRPRVRRPPERDCRPTVLREHVTHVVCVRAEEQMALGVVGVDAWRVVAVVKDAKSVGDRPVSQLPCGSVSENQARLTDRSHSVAVAVAPSAPQAAAARPVYNFRAEPQGEHLAGIAVVGQLKVASSGSRHSHYSTTRKGRKKAQQWERLGRAVPPVMMRAVAETIRDRVLT